MCALRRLAFGPQVVAIALIGLSAASCSNDSGRFSGLFASDNPSRNEPTGSVPPGASGHVDSGPMPHLAGGEGTSGGGRGMGSYQPGNGEITGTLRPAATKWTWEGGKPIVVAPGENLEIISRRYGVPVAAVMEANSITSPAMVHPGQHLVIPRLRGPVAATAQPPTRIASNTSTVPSAAPVGPPRTALAPTSSVHVVAPGETLHSIARLYGKPVMVLAKANNIPPDTMVRVGERITIPDVRSAAAPAPVVPRAETPAAAPAGPTLASAESPHSVRLATPAAAPVSPQSAVKTAEPAGGLPSFRWPVRGRIIAGFGPKPNGLQNDGINLAVPEGTPVKAAEDGVVAYAGNELKGYGNLVLVRHSNGFVTAYAHASEILVKRGDEVKRGQVIAKSGQSGNVTAPQLHFEIRKGATPVDPAQYLNGA
jgi:murein DD-endopeptidase MepM/ murein hydrolase activator NlpD